MLGSQIRYAQNRIGTTTIGRIGKERIRKPAEMAGIIYFEIYHEKAISLSCWTFHIVNTYLLDNFKQIIEIQHANHSSIAECQGSEEKEKRPFNCWSNKTEFEVRSSLRKESLRRKVSYGYEDNRRRRDWLVVRIRSLSEYKNGYFLLQRTNQRHSELVCYWPACKQRVESIKANVREKDIMS